MTMIAATTVLLSTCLPLPLLSFRFDSRFCGKTIPNNWAHMFDHTIFWVLVFYTIDILLFSPAWLSPGRHMLFLSQSNDSAYDNSKAALELLQFCLNTCDDNNKQALCKTISHHAGILLKSLSLKSRRCRCWGSCIFNQTAPLIRFCAASFVIFSNCCRCVNYFMFEKGEDSPQRVNCFVFLRELVAVKSTFVYLVFFQSHNHYLRLDMHVFPMHFGTPQRLRGLGAYPLPMIFR